MGYLHRKDVRLPTDWTEVDTQRHRELMDERRRELVKLNASKPNPQPE